MNKARPTLPQIAVMVAFALSCVGLLLFLWSSFGGPVPMRAKAYEVTARFRDGSQLARYSDVRISGVTVGKVVRITSRDGTAETRLRIDPELAPLPRGTIAMLRTKTLLGETFVALSTGDRSAVARGVPGSFIPDGGTIPQRNVRAGVLLDEVLDAFAPSTREDLRTTLVSLARATRDRGGHVNAAAGDLAPALRSADALLRVVDRQSAEVRSGIRDVGTTLGVLGERTGALRELTRAGSRVLGTTAEQAAPLRATLRRLPALLRRTRSTVAEARRAARDARPTLDALRPVTPRIAPALRDLTTLAPDLRDALVAARPALRAARRGLPAVDRVADTLGPAMDVLSPVSSDLLPIARHLEDHRRDIGVTFANTAAATQATAPDLRGRRRHYLRTSLAITDELLAGAARRVPGSRTNPYPAPDAMDRFGTRTMPSTSCAHTTNATGLLTPLLGGAGPPCLTSASPAFPRLTPVRPEDVPDGP
ncbi:MlaD family protein [Patulibacter sp.]|uniref:MlaD family protein n=1 Tax=Patulibacter sp. TaxID=1912859 RepID=UPI002722AFDF|nr:MlaD family protein [Patulibacter sp.]MDO9410009.1 MlaD family protein [Patulibacter sp.]